MIHLIMIIFMIIIILILIILLTMIMMILMIIIMITLMMMMILIFMVVLGRLGLLPFESGRHEPPPVPSRSQEGKEPHIFGSTFPIFWLTLGPFLDSFGPFFMALATLL